MRNAEGYGFIEFESVRRGSPDARSPYLSVVGLFGDGFLQPHDSQPAGTIRPLSVTAAIPHFAHPPFPVSLGEGSAPSPIITQMTNYNDKHTTLTTMMTLTRLKHILICNIYIYIYIHTHTRIHNPTNMNRLRRAPHPLRLNRADAGHLLRQALRSCPLLRGGGRKEQFPDHPNP